jgi:hypothetical protein
MNELSLKKNVQNWIIQAFNDPIVKILSKNSHLTKTQLETLLIDILSENMSGKQLKYDEKAKLRLTKAKITRGAFNRTLQQAKENVTRSIYTILLLGYLGILETTQLNLYIEIANKLHEYLDAYKNMPKTDEKLNEHLKLMEIIREELQSTLLELTKR